MAKTRRAARDSRKHATRVALREAAIGLALEHGPRNVRESDVAAAVGVPLHVFRSCFRDADHAIVAAVVDEQHDRLMSAIAAAPPDVRLRPAVTNAIMETYTSSSRRMRLILEDPALRDEYRNTAGLIEDQLAAVIAERLGTDRRDVVWPARSITIAVKNALKQWLPPGEPPGRSPAWWLRLSLMTNGAVLDLIE